jgi:predicted Zn-dependent protease
MDSAIVELRNWICRRLAARRAAQMPECCGDHKFMISDLLPFRRHSDRLPVQSDMTASAATFQLPAFARKTATAVMAGLVLFAGSAGPAPAQQQNVPIVRDAEIEALVRDYVGPILQAAGLSKSGIKIVLVNDRRFNAFVDGRRIFINTGALMTSETPNEIIGVLAHETGHLAGGHQQNMREQLARAQTMAIVASLLGVGAMAAGAATDNKSLAQGGIGVLAGGSEMARRGLLNYQRGEEVIADRSAVTYLAKTKQSAKGMLKTFQRFQSAMSLSGTQVDPYQISHPIPRERIANLQELATTSPYFDVVDPPALQLRHDMMRAKIAAYSSTGAAAVSRLFGKGGSPVALAYGDAISTFLHGNLKTALAKTDALIKTQPKNPYLYELRGDILLKSNKANDAAASYAKAVSLDPVKSGLLKVAYGQALVAAGDEESLRKAVTILSTGLDRDKENAEGYRYLAQAHGMLGEIPQADLATAEGYFYGGGYKDAKIFAARAQQSMKRGSPGWVRAQDIINFKMPKKKK